MYGRLLRDLPREHVSMASNDIINAVKLTGVRLGIEEYLHIWSTSKPKVGDVIHFSTIYNCNMFLQRAVFADLFIGNCE